MDLGDLGNKLINEISKTMENNKNINLKGSSFKLLINNRDVTIWLVS